MSKSADVTGQPGHTGLLRLPELTGWSDKESTPSRTLDVLEPAYSCRAVSSSNRRVQPGMEPKGIEPSTSGLQSRRSPN